MPNDGMGIRTPENHRFIRLAILRHTGLDYPVNFGNSKSDSTSIFLLLLNPISSNWSNNSSGKFSANCIALLLSYQYLYRPTDNLAYFQCHLFQCQSYQSSFSMSIVSIIFFNVNRINHLLLCPNSSTYSSLYIICHLPIL